MNGFVRSLQEILPGPLLTRDYLFRISVQGVGESIAEREAPKILLLNGSHDRETSVGKDSQGLMTASDIVLVICSALNRENSSWHSGLSMGVKDYVTHVLAPVNGGILVDHERLHELGVR